MPDNMNRRDFLRAVALSSAALAVGPSVLPAAEPPSANPARLPRRPYKPGVELSIVGFASIMLRLYDQPRSDRIVAKACERGCNYYDVAPAYGNAQERLGPALAPYRKNCFLSCKTKKRDAAGAAAEMKRSLDLLRTDHFDLYQLHCVKDARDDVDAVFMKGGAMEAILEAKKQGIIRYVGFTAHTTEAAIAAMNRFDFDSIMFPLNFASVYKGDFGPPMLDLARKKKLAQISIKSLCRQEWPPNADRGQWRHVWYQPLTDRREADLGLRWALSQGITSALPPGDEDVFFLATDIAMQYKPITADEDKELRALAATLNPLFRAGKITE